MTLLAPWALWFSAVAAAVVALYLLRIRRRRETVPALDFWRQLAGQTQVRSLFQRLKRWLSLALWLFIVACLVLSLGNPVVSLGRIKPQSIAVILDNSASMQAVDAGDSPEAPATRWAAALAALDDLAARRPVSDQWLLIEAGQRARVVAPWTIDRRQMMDGAGTIVPHRGAADLAGAKALADQLLDGRERPAIVILSDGANGRVAQMAAADAKVVPWPLGTSDDNAGITRLSVRPHRDEASHYAYVCVVNAASKPVEARLVIELDGSTAAVEPLQLEAGATWEKTLTLNRPEGGVLRAFLDRADLLADDDEAFAILPPIRAASVLLVSPPEQSFYFEQALTAMSPLVDAENSVTVTLDEYNAAAGGLDAVDLVLFNNGAPERLPNAGRFVFVNRWPGDLPATASGVIDLPEMAVSSRDHPLMRFVNVNGVTLARAARVALTDQATVLAATIDNQPLIFFHEAPNRQSLCLAFDVLESDLPFRNAFPVLLRNAVGYLVTEKSKWVDDQCTIGSAIRPLRPLPADIDEVSVARLRKAEESVTRAAVEGGSFVIRDTHERGPLRIAIGDEIAYTAVNLADENETRIAPMVADRSPSEMLALTDRLFGTVPWLALAAAAAALIGLEWFTYHYRWTE